MALSTSTKNKVQEGISNSDARLKKDQNLEHNDEQAPSFLIAVAQRYCDVYKKIPPYQAWEEIWEYANTVFADSIVPLLLLSLGSMSLKEVQEALSAIALLSGVLAGGIHLDSQVHASIRSFWDRVLSWMAILNQTYILDDLPPHQIEPEQLEELREKILITTAKTVSAFNALQAEEGSDAHLMLEKVPSFYPTILKASIHLAQVSSSDQLFPIDFWHLRELPNGKEQLIDAFTTVRSRYNMAGTLLSILDKEVNRESRIRAKTLDSALNFIFFIFFHVRECYEPIRDFLSQGAIPLCLDILDFIATDIASHTLPQRQTFLDCTASLCLIIRCSFHCGFTWVSQSLNSGKLLSTLVKTWIVLTCGPDGRLEKPSDRTKQGNLKQYGELLQSLYLFLIFRTVLIRILRECRNVRECRMLEKLHKKDLL
ncbi:hypothetical protein AAF712_008088 [Marasmius tenuissimus]|uniref:Uncharacterized protein n=1 Tax=Marasmius tenuissimus TaxID=585030 RepID=A0ABR2ZV71_9AGAR